MKQQKSQVLIEFALIFPLFLLLVFGIFLFGSIFADYLTLSTIARNSAREASVIMVKEESQRQAECDNVRAKYKDYRLPLDVYRWDPKDMNDFYIKADSNNHNIIVTIHAELNENGTMFAKLVDDLSDSVSDDSNALDLNITYTMYSENNLSSGG